MFHIENDFFSMIYWLQLSDRHRRFQEDCRHKLGLGHHRRHLHSRPRRQRRSRESKFEFFFGHFLVTFKVISN